MFELMYPSYIVPLHLWCNPYVSLYINIQILIEPNTSQIEFEYLSMVNHSIYNERVEEKEILLYIFIVLFF